MDAPANQPAGAESDRPPPVRRDRQAQWLAVVSGARRDPAARLARAGLRVLEGLYRVGLAVADLRWRRPGAVRRAPCPVISVGNLTVGGTGKTPMVAYLAGLLLEAGYRPLIVSRGYGAETGAPNEEAEELAERCPGVPQVQHPDRLRAILDFRAAQPCDVVLLDDGFQHRRLARDLDIVLVDARRPFGYGHLLPRGLLREPPSALRRADLVVLTRADLASEADLDRTREALSAHLRPGADLAVAEHRPLAVHVYPPPWGVRPEAGDLHAGWAGRSEPPEWLRGRAVAAACAIANPEAFEHTINRLGAHVVRFDAFRDHHRYTAEDLDRLLRAAAAAGVEVLLTTQKDFVKWRPVLASRLATGPLGEDATEVRPVAVAVLAVGIHLVEGEEQLRHRVLAAVAAAERPAGEGAG